MEAGGTACGRPAGPIALFLHMRAVLQRVCEARVEVDGKVTGQIGAGLLILLGIAKMDSVKDAAYLVEKAIHLRIFPDDSGKMNRSLLETGGSVLVVSQFTLYGDCRKGRRPAFDKAADAVKARELYEYFVSEAGKTVPVATGIFQANMKVYSINDGPVTLICESPQINSGPE